MFVYLRNIKSESKNSSHFLRRSPTNVRLATSHIVHVRSTPERNKLMKKTSRTSVLPIAQPPISGCAIHRCRHPHHRRGLCKAHYEKRNKLFGSFFEAGLGLAE